MAFATAIGSRILAMHYTRHRPAPPLNTYIDDLYYLDGIVPYASLKVFPMPSLHLMINVGPAFQVRQPDQRIATWAESWCVGLWNTYHVVDWPRSVRLYGVHFKPGGAYPFMQLPLSELQNQIVSLDTIWPHDAFAIQEQLAAAPTAQAGLAWLEQRLLARLHSIPDRVRAVQSAVEAIAHYHGALSIRALSEHIGVSQNHLETLFKQLVGIPPKGMARCYRFAHILHTVDPTQPVDWARIAQDAAFYDQAHFNKDFVTFTGYTPTDYLRLRCRLQRENPELAQSLGQMLID